MSFELRYLEETKDRLMAWMMDDLPAESIAHDWVARGYAHVSKACQIVAENEEYEREQSDGG